MAEAGQALMQAGSAAGSAPGAAAGPMGQLLGNDRLLRQAGLLLGLAAAVAVGIGLFFWAQEPVHRPLYANLTEQDAAQVLEALEAVNVPYRIDSRNGAITVPAGEVHGVRLRLAGQGLPRGAGVGYEILQRDASFGTSQFMENARFQRALETELARSISTLQPVESARVHLAVPKPSVFARERAQPRASVVVNLASGRSLNEGQIAAITHLVASSVPELAEEEVTLVDQRGRLLSRNDSTPLGGSSRQFEYRQQLEESYVRRIESLLTPVVGAGRVRAQVNARLDFSVEESTAEVFDPAGSVIRSEQISEERRRQLEGAAVGVPGALANQPPGAGVLVEGDEPVAGRDDTVNLNSSATRNFEVSKTIRHVRRPVGSIERLSVAVLVDERDVVGADGRPAREPLEQAELDRLAALVRDAVGFDETRGDTLNVINAPFRDTPERVELPGVPLLEQPWVLEMGKLALAVVLGLVLILAVIRPLIFGLLGRRKDEPAAGRGAQAQLEGNEPLRQLPSPRHSAAEAHALAFGTELMSYDESLTAARQVVSQEPALAANVVRNWLAHDE